MGGSRWMILILSVSTLPSSCGEAEPTPLCPAPPVTYETRVLPEVLRPYCLDCHASSRMGPERDGAPEDLNLDDWSVVSKRAGDIANAVTSGSMPPEDRARPSPYERELVDGWRRCGFVR